MIWNILTSVATLISTIAYIVTALYIRAQLQAVEKDRYIAVTSDLFALWQSKEFMEAQLWLLHKMQEQTWEDFVVAHRADMGETAFHRVGGFYDRVGTLTRLGLINDEEILVTIGGYAIAVWQKIAPLVYEARKIENSSLFENFEKLLPACYECYVPSLGGKTHVRPFEISETVNKVTPAAVSKRLQKKEPLTLLDVRQASNFAADRRTLPGAVVIPPDDVANRFGDLPNDREVVVYCA